MDSVDLKAWLGRSCAVDAAGSPLLVYRGEWGRSQVDAAADASTGHWLQARSTGYSYGSVAAANLYATSPNNIRDPDLGPELQSRLIPAYLRIERPLVDQADDPFVDLATLRPVVGDAAVRRIALKFADHISSTGHWDENYAHEYESVQSFVSQAQDHELDGLYFELYHLLDDQDEVRMLKALGIDGAIYGGSGASALEPEYRVFDVDQVLPAIAAGWPRRPIERPRLDERRAEDFLRSTVAATRQAIVELLGGDARELAEGAGRYVITTSREVGAHANRERWVDAMNSIAGSTGLERRLAGRRLIARRLAVEFTSQAGRTIVGHASGKRWTSIEPDEAADLWRCRDFSASGFGGVARFNTRAEAQTYAKGRGYVEPDPRALDRLQDTTPFVRGLLAADLSARMAAGEMSVTHAEERLLQFDATSSVLEMLARTAAQAVFMPHSSTMYLLADRIELGQEQAVFLHEIVHKFGRQTLGPLGFDRLVQGVKSWAGARAGSIEQLIYFAANARASKAAQHSPLDAALTDEELVAYAVEEAVARGVRPSALARAGTAEEWLSDVEATLRGVVAQIAGRSPLSLTPQQLVDLSYALAQLESPEHADKIRRRLSPQALDQVNQLASDLRSPIWSSALAQAVRANPARQLSAPAWLDWMGSLHRQGVSPAEVEWSGVREWLGMQGRLGQKIGREMVLGFLSANGVRLSEDVRQAPAFESLVAARDVLTGDIEKAGFEVEIDYDGELCALIRTEDGQRFAASPQGFIGRGGQQLQGDAALTAQRLRKALEEVVDAEEDSGNGDSYSTYSPLSPVMPVETAAYYELLLILGDDGEVRVRGLPSPGARRWLPERSYFGPHWDAANVVAHVRFTVRKDSAGQDLCLIHEIQSDWGQIGRRHGFGELTESGQVPGAPFVQSTQAWVGLAFKRMLRFAAENNIDQIAILNGATIATSARQRQPIGSVDWVLASDGQFRILAHPTSSGEAIIRKALAPSAVVDWLGEAGRRIVAGEGRFANDPVTRINGDQRGSIRTPGLELGGDGMIDFYDRVVPRIARDVLRRLGVGGVSTVDIAGVGTVLGMHMSAGLKEVAMRPLPMFSLMQGATRMEIAAQAAVAALQNSEQMQRFKAQGLEIDFGARGDALELYSIRTPEPRGQGMGTQVLKLLTNAADTWGVAVELEVGPMSSGIDLVAWYARHGFEWAEGYMKRSARPERAAPRHSKLDSQQGGYTPSQTRPRTRDLAARFSFAGEAANGADVSSLRSAKAALGEAVDQEFIRKETGWFQGPDERWRFEIDDSQAKLGPGFERLIQNTTVHNERAMLDQVLIHPAMYEAYPDLASVRVGLKAMGSSSLAYLSRTTNEIFLNVYMATPSSALSSLIHEVQHLVQYTEGFAPGSDMSGNVPFLDGRYPQRFVDARNSLLKEIRAMPYGSPDGRPLWGRLNKIEREGIFERYRTSAGEVEARNVQARQALSPSERLRTSPWTTADVAMGDQFVDKLDVGAGAAESSAGTDTDAAQQDFEVLVSELGKADVADLLLNWCDAELTDDGEILQYLGRDRHFTPWTSEDGGKPVLAEKAEFLAWLHSATPMDAGAYAADAVAPGSDWRALIERARVVTQAWAPVRVDPNAAHSHGRHARRTKPAWSSRPKDAAFQRWMEGSVVRSPLFHATNQVFEQFDTSRGDLGTHLGSLKTASTHAQKLAGAGAPAIIPVWLSIKNPLRLQDRGSFHADGIAAQLERKGMLPRGEGARIEAACNADWQQRKVYDPLLRQRILEAGYDGVVYRNEHEGGGDSYIALAPYQMRPAIATHGQVQQSPSFLRWFDGSRVVNEAAQPLMLFRGARSGEPLVGIQDPVSSKVLDVVWASSSREQAAFFQDGEIQHLYFNLRNPFIAREDQRGGKSLAQVAREVREAVLAGRGNWDGVVFPAACDGMSVGDVFVAFPDVQGQIERRVWQAGRCAYVGSSGAARIEGEGPPPEREDWERWSAAVELECTSSQSLLDVHAQICEPDSSSLRQRERQR